MLICLLWSWLTNKFRENFTEEKRKKMVETPRIKESAYYYFSWHDDFAKILKANNSRTVPEDLADIVLNWK